MKTKKFKLLPSQRQLVHLRLLSFIKEKNSDDIYPLIDIVNILRANLGDEPLKEEFNGKYPTIMKYFSKITLKLYKFKLNKPPFSSINLTEHRIIFHMFKILIKKTDFGENWIYDSPPTFLWSNTFNKPRKNLSKEDE